MSELISDNLRLFNKDFLKFRKTYYINETKELLARHKLLSAFIICLLAPGIQNIQAIGVPFYTIIEPSSSLGIKLLFLVPLLFFLIALTQAQSKFIKGGTFRDYLNTFFIPSSVCKKIDATILLLSLNVVWLAILFGAGKVHQLQGSSAQLFSYYCLYGSMIMAIVVLLLHSLYKSVLGGLILIAALILIAFASTANLWWLNSVVSLGVGFLSAILAFKVQPYKMKAKPFKTSSIELIMLTTGSSLKVFFLTQLATYRANKNKFFIRISLCVFLSIISFNLFFSEEFITNRKGFLLILISFQTYTLSTLFTFFAKDELDYAVFYSIFPYQTIVRRPIEIVAVNGLLLLSVIPIVVFSLFSTPSYFLPVLMMLTINMVAVVVNRALYAYSLRFCLFTSLLNTAGSIFVQYLLIGEFFGN
jgi:hypothetical protein